MITLAGARNVFADCDGDYQQVGWEDVIAENPDWIQLGVRNRGSEAANEKAFDEAEKWLKSNAATKGLKAVEEGHFLRIGSEQTTIAGVAQRRHRRGDRQDPLPRQGRLAVASTLLRGTATDAAPDARSVPAGPLWPWSSAWCCWPR